MNLLARSYLDVQQTRVALEGRMRKLTEEICFYLLEEKACKVVELSDGFDRKPKAIQKAYDAWREHIGEGLWKYDKDKEKYWVQYYSKNGARPTDVMLMLLAHAKVLHKQEKVLLTNAKTLFSGTELWDWCERTRGLGPVAATTFLGYINPKICTTVGKIKAYIGMTPNSKLRSGEKANFNPEVKGRFWVTCGRNIIMARDDYYPTLLGYKKEYYTNRPDRLETKELGEKGWKGHNHNMAMRWMIGIVLGNALEIMRESEGLPVDNIQSHRGYIPPKPKTVGEQVKVLERLKPYILQGQN